MTGVEIKLTNIDEQMSSLKLETSHSSTSQPQLGSFFNPAPSCKLIPQCSHSGYYWIQNTKSGYASQVYCDMTRRYCNSIGGCMSVANLDMTDTNQHCPSGFRLITSPKRTCGTPGSRCVSTTFPLNGVKYSRVCGKIIGYVPIPLMHLIPTILFVVTQLTVSMLMELASLMIKDQGNIFGHL